ncbi:MAG: class 1 isoprenoid biosynthesis enzyme [Methanomicrobiaceae archaeon]|nr:class 1 isoprenoid biosynthesis enzyme [Methanomicrobiaceae archaeon]
MMRELKKTLCRDSAGSDIYTISYQFAASNFSELEAYMKSGYNPGDICRNFRKEHQRLRRIKGISRSVAFLDTRFNTNISKRLKSGEFSRAKEKTLRFALMRDMGADSETTNISGLDRELAESLLLKDSSDSERLYADPCYFAATVKDLYGVSDDTAFLWLHGYLCEFIGICPGRYLEKGIFGKFMRAILGVMFFARINRNTDFDKICRLAAYFGITYLFDDIIDDPEYTEQEKNDYYGNVLAILKSGKGDTVNYSGDLLMKFSEKALIGIRGLLDEKSGIMLSQAYIAIAQASRRGSEWTYETPLSEMEMYSVAAVKAAYTRVIPAILAGVEIDEKFLSHCLRAGLIYQLTDDLRDIPDDLSEENVTPFNYYRYGVCRMQFHPVDVLNAAVYRISEDCGVSGACDLWVMRITHALRVLQLKYGDRDISGVFRELDFPDEAVIAEMAGIAECFDIIVDIEAFAAEYYSGISLGMKEGLDRKHVYGH